MTLHYDCVGQPSAPLVIVVGGIGQQIGDVELCDEYAERFASAGLPVARMDNRDAGLSSSFELWRADWGTSFPFDEAWVRERAASSYDGSYRPDGLYRQMTAGFATPSIWEAQRSIECPTLVMHGTEDPFFPLAHGEATSMQIPHATLWRVEGMGHTIHREVWDEMIDRVGELARR